MPKTVVCIKQALDVTEMKVDSATRRLITEDAPRKISEFDKNALEEAVQLKERLGGEVVAVTATSEDAKMTVREALAMGADKAYIISDSALENSDTLATSHVLCKAIKKIGAFDLVLCGEASVDSYSAQVGPRLAERLGIPQITYVRKLSLDGDAVTVERSLEECYETVKAQIPVLLTVTGEINEPRIPSLMAIMKASKKPIVEWNLDDLNISKDEVGGAGSAIEVTEVLAPKVERKSITLKGETTEEVAEKLAMELIKEGVVGR